MRTRVVAFGHAISADARLLRDSSSTFFEALSAVTKPYPRDELFRRLQEWLKSGAPLTR